MEPAFGATINSVERDTLQGPLVVQVVSVTNIAQPTKRQHEDSNPRMLLLKLNDGHTSASAIEFERIPELSTKVAPGTKILIKNSVPICCGKILLSGKSCRVLGGRVDHLFKAWLTNRTALSNRKQKKQESSGEREDPPEFELNIVASKAKTAKGDKVSNLNEKGINVATKSKSVNSTTSDKNTPPPSHEARQQDKQQKKGKTPKVVTKDARRGPPPLPNPSLEVTHGSNRPPPPPAVQKKQPKVSTEHKGQHGQNQPSKEHKRQPNENNQPKEQKRQLKDKIPKHSNEPKQQPKEPKKVHQPKDKAHSTEKQDQQQKEHKQSKHANNVHEQKSHATKGSVGKGQSVQNTSGRGGAKGTTRPKGGRGAAHSPSQPMDLAATLDKVHISPSNMGTRTTKLTSTAPVFVPGAAAAQVSSSTKPDKAKSTKKKYTFT